MSLNPINVMLVDDSPVALAMLKRLLAPSPEIRIVGTALDGVQALQLLGAARPDVLLTDLRMPNMDGVELTQRVMAEYPCPILVVSSTIRADDTTNAYPALAAGALDVFPKPELGSTREFEAASQELVAKIRILSGVRVYRRKAGAAPVAAASTAAPAAPGPDRRPRPRLVVIGASTGGPPALKEVLRQLPAGFPLPVLCVQHISKGFLTGLVDWLAQDCALPVRIGKPDELPAPGVVYFPPEDRHMELSPQGLLRFTEAPPVEGHRPSATVTLASAAERCGGAAIGVLLTGMGRDGAEGLLEIRRRGGLTFAQDEETSAVFGMPRQAIELGAVERVLPPVEIGRALARVLAA
ncbi:MAG: chemotaxis-specific protein-glutamate methyltransferase CheB [Armatimonadota bacterium]